MSQDDFKDLEDLDEILETDEEPQMDHSKIVQEVQKKAKQGQPAVEVEERKRWNPAGACFPGAEVIDGSPRFCQDGVMVDQLSSETIDPESMNFLLAKQREKLEPDDRGVYVIGGSFRAPNYEELEQVLDDGLSCPFCSEKFSKEDTDFHELGTLVSYGGTIYHWACLGLWMLIKAKGHPEKAAATYHVDLRDIRGIKTSYRAIPFGRLGWTREGSQ